MTGAFFIVLFGLATAVAGGAFGWHLNDFWRYMDRPPAPAPLPRRVPGASFIGNPPPPLPDERRPRPSWDTPTMEVPNLVCRPTLVHSHRAGAR